MSTREQRGAPARRGGGVAGNAGLAFAGWWALLLGLWLALAGSADAQELAAGIVAGALGAGAAVAVRGQRLVLPRPRARWIARLGRPIAAYPRDLWLLARGLASALAGRAPGGEVYAVAFTVRDDPRGAARRMLASAGGSLAPNVVVLGFDRERDLLVVHRLVAHGDAREAADPLGLG